MKLDSPARQLRETQSALHFAASPVVRTSRLPKARSPAMCDYPRISFWPKVRSAVRAVVHHPRHGDLERNGPVVPNQAEELSAPNHCGPSHEIFQRVAPDEAIGPDERGASIALPGACPRPANKRLPGISRHSPVPQLPFRARHPERPPSQRLQAPASRSTERNRSAIVNEA